MLILFDHGTPAPLRSFLRNHTVKKTKDLGWDTLSNGELLRAAEEAAFEIFLTTDKNIRRFIVGPRLLKNPSIFRDYGVARYDDSFLKLVCNFPCFRFRELFRQRGR